eukprot:CAMPEP_0113673880 /NCGR_PEP_ID=MMETSP0038_2-20120614/7097_1 /TAXON_ID=2898 /ORGANISM="Cryptomonas paramecium" /LENGTH=104 /DNA_ID=CAMNT_0000590375 /DNA_START=410 /DNA_END=721 /DNA_ORIENTATION=+ /assembly_acc=CAM_ASM_000170
MQDHGMQLYGSLLILPRMRQRSRLVQILGQAAFGVQRGVAQRWDPDHVHRPNRRSIESLLLRAGGSAWPDGRGGRFIVFWRRPPALAAVDMIARAPLEGPDTHW